MNKYNLSDIEEIIEDVRLCTLLRCTKNGKINSLLAEEYLNWINEYAKYCIPEMQECWKSDIRDTLYNPLVPKPGYQDNPHVKEISKLDNFRIIDILSSFKDAGEIMKTYDDTHSWDEVDIIFEKQGHSGHSYSELAGVMIKYASIGVDFIDRYCAYYKDSGNNKFKDMYNDAKEYMETRKELNKRLIYAIDRKSKLK